MSATTISSDRDDDSGPVTSTEAGPDLWEITMKIDGVLWVSWQWGEENRDKAERVARRLTT